MFGFFEGAEDGVVPFDLGDVDIARMQPFQGNKHYLMQRSTETLGLLYADHFPYRQYASARDVRHTPFHERMAEFPVDIAKLSRFCSRKEEKETIARIKAGNV